MTLLKGVWSHGSQILVNWRSSHIFFPVGLKLNLEYRPQQLNNPPTRVKSKYLMLNSESCMIHLPTTSLLSPISKHSDPGAFLVPSNTPSFSVWISCPALHMWTYEHMSPERRLVLTEKKRILSFLHITLCPHLSTFLSFSPRNVQRPCLS